MRLRGFFVVAALVAAQLGVALGQQAASTAKTQTPSGLSLSFDALHGQLTASGIAVKSRPLTTPAGATSVTGTVNLTITINLVSKIGHEARIPCAAILIGGEADTSVPIVDGGIETASGAAMVDWKAKTATCTLSIPYEWTLITDTAAGEGLFVGFAAADVDHWDNTRRSTIQIGGPLPLPPSGTTTTLAFTTTL
ncbi:MAG TPA: hypothetical protein VLZ50_02830 [Terracidiphilus sp.]|nr:hypothetical protein [Terracidiphilus sp.]